MLVLASVTRHAHAVASYLLLISVRSRLQSRRALLVSGAVDRHRQPVSPVESSTLVPLSSRRDGIEHAARPLLVQASTTLPAVEAHCAISSAIDSAGREHREKEGGVAEPGHLLSRLLKQRCEGATLGCASSETRPSAAMATHYTLVAWNRR